MGSGNGQNPSPSSARPVQQGGHTQGRGGGSQRGGCCDFCLSGEPEFGATLWVGPPWGPPRPSPSPPPCSQPPTGNIPLYGMTALHPNAGTPARAISRGTEGLLTHPTESCKGSPRSWTRPGSSLGWGLAHFACPPVFWPHSLPVSAQTLQALCPDLSSAALCPAGPLGPTPGFPALGCAAVCSHAPPRCRPPGHPLPGAPVPVDVDAPSLPLPGTVQKEAVTLLHIPGHRAAKPARALGSASAGMSAFLFYFLSLSLQQIWVCLAHLCVLST